MLPPHPFVITPDTWRAYSPIASLAREQFKGKQLKRRRKTEAETSVVFAWLVRDTGRSVRRQVAAANGQVGRSTQTNGLVPVKRKRPMRAAVAVAPPA